MMTSSPHETATVSKMRSDLQRIKNMIDDLDPPDSKMKQLVAINHVLRELLTSWQGITAADYQTDERLHLNMLTKRMLESE
jgi:hypothetical protein